MVAPRFAKLFAVAASAAFACSMVGVPAYALTDTNLDEWTTGTSTGVSATPVSTDESPSLQGQPSADQVESMPDNPTKDLPQTVSEEIPDDATVVSEELAVTDDGEVMDLETGDTVTDPQLVGTVDKPADPLAKTDGESFIPVEVAEVKEAMGDDTAVPESDDAVDTAETEGDGDVAEPQRDTADEGATGAVVRPAALQNNSYGAHWGTYNGTPAFFESDGTLFVQQAKGVIDVSEWQRQIDWQKAKNDGVEGAIIRISYGWGNGFDKQALRNISECKRLGIPFGIYSYSYAYDSTTAAYEGDDMVNLLRQAGVQPGDLSYPVFYDLEKWTWTGHTPPTSPSVYDGIVNAWYAKLQTAGYNNLSVYSYTNYLDTALNSANIRNKTRWVASYGARTNFPFATNDRGWQYTSGGSIDGIDGRVDLNVFGILRYPTKGAIANYRKGNKWLGAPTGEELTVKGGASQTFQGGTVFWNGKTGATHAVKGGILSEYGALKWEQGLLGFPTSDEMSLSDGASQTFQNGQIHWSNATGAHFTRGSIQGYWSGTGWQDGWLGYPTNDELTVRGGASQEFQGGTVLWNGKNNTTYATKGGIRTEYAALSWERGLLGFPTSNEMSLNGGASQTFQNGQIHWSGATGAHFTRGAIQSFWASQGWQDGWLGYPTGDELTVRGGASQTFQGGTVFWNAATGETYAGKGSILNAYGRLGYEQSWLGFPTSGEIDDSAKPGEVYQNFQHGQIHWRSRNNSTYITRW